MTGSSTRLRSAALVVLVLAALPAAGSVPDLISYQGRLLTPVNTPIVTPTHLRFRIFQGGDATTFPSTGTLVYHETATVTPATTGVFSHLIGSGAPADGCPEGICSLSAGDFPDAPTPLWIEVMVDPDGTLGTSDDDVLLPRTRVGTVGYAYRVSTVDGATGGDVTGPLAADTLRARGGAVIGEGLDADLSLTFDRAGAPDPVLQWRPAEGRLRLSDPLEIAGGGEALLLSAPGGATIRGADDTKLALCSQSQAQGDMCLEIDADPAGSLQFNLSNAHLNLGGNNLMTSGDVGTPFSYINDIYTRSLNTVRHSDAFGSIADCIADLPPADGLCFVDPDEDDNSALSTTTHGAVSGKNDALVQDTRRGRFHLRSSMPQPLDTATIQDIPFVFQVSRRDANAWEAEITGLLPSCPTYPFNCGQSIEGGFVVTGPPILQISDSDWDGTSDDTPILRVGEYGLALHEGQALRGINVCTVRSNVSGGGKANSPAFCAGTGGTFIDQGAVFGNSLTWPQPFSNHSYGDTGNVLFINDTLNQPDIYMEAGGGSSTRVPFIRSYGHATVALPCTAHPCGILAFELHEDGQVYLGPDADGTQEIRDEGRITFEGDSNDDFETTLSVVDPGADHLFRLPNPETAVSDGRVMTSPNEIGTGGIFYGDTDIAAYDTGDEVCNRRGLTCVTSISMGAMNPANGEIACGSVPEATTETTTSGHFMVLCQ